ncbi:vesicle transport protein SFT2B isoform X2 [Rosa chinensis]|uniref:vesicle transport protein SFT2B isoform X2 n=1 Tax=Rosa chinensis TaxID=74649 RepID=UPI000D0974EA|nr:vesicle transport protein SFT2B isoform X2 [Rosa chinensis]
MEKISQAFEKVKMNQAFEKVNVNQAFDKMKMLVGMEADNDDDEEAASSSSALQHQDSFMDDFNRNCTLSTKQSMLVFFHPIKFAITFTLGNLLSLGSTAFLIGPKRQVTMMLDPVRIYATAIYIASIIIALFCALYAHNKILTLLAIILEFGALVWYSLSYIPFARSMVSKIMLACFDTEF